MKKKTTIGIVVFLVFVTVWSIVTYQEIVIFKEAYGQLGIDIRGAQNVSPEVLSGIPTELESEVNSTIIKSMSNPNKAYIIINSDTSWQATIMDSGNDFTTTDGFGIQTLEFECEPGFFSMYSTSVQKQTESGSIIMGIMQGGDILDSGRTAAQYGIVSLSGECNKPG